MNKNENEKDTSLATAYRNTFNVPKYPLEYPPKYPLKYFSRDLLKHALKDLLNRYLLNYLKKKKKIMKRKKKRKEWNYRVSLARLLCLGQVLGPQFCSFRCDILRTAFGSPEGRLGLGV